MAIFHPSPRGRSLAFDRVFLERDLRTARSEEHGLGEATTLALHFKPLLPIIPQTPLFSLELLTRF